MSRYSFKAKIWKYPGMGGWHFVNLPDKYGKEIRKEFGKGMLKVFAEVGGSKWNASLFPFKNPKGEINYLVAVVSKIRKQENIFDGDTIKMTFKI